MSYPDKDRLCLKVYADCIIAVSATEREVGSRVTEAIIGLVGITLGVALTEFVRRRARIESYAAPVFEKRLALYEGLHARLRQCADVATEVLNSPKLTKGQRHELVSAAVLEMAGYADEHELYISEELTLHCTCLLMGIEDIPDLPEGPEKTERIEQFHADLLAAKRMVRKEAGITDLDGLFRSITKPKHSSAIIEYYRGLLKEKGRKGKWEEP